MIRSKRAAAAGLGPAESSVLITDWKVYIYSNGISLTNGTDRMSVHPSKVKGCVSGATNVYEPDGCGLRGLLPTGWPAERNCLQSSGGE